MIDAIDNPACRTLPQWRAIRATPNRIAPQRTVAYRARRTQIESGRVARERGFRKSITVVEANEFSAALRFDIAAAKMAAITNPAIPTGRCCQMNSG